MGILFQCMYDCTTVVSVVVVSKKTAALNTTLRSNSLNDLVSIHGLNRTINTPIMKYFNTMFRVLR